MYFNNHEDQCAEARVRVAELRRGLREHGIAVRVGDDDETVMFPRGESPPQDNLPVDPGGVFRDRLHTILREAVARLEQLSEEVLPDWDGDGGSDRDGGSA